MQVVLDTIKKTLGISKDDTSFDSDITLYINSSLSILSQMGLTEAGETPIIDETTMWIDLLNGRDDLEIVKTYISFKVKSMFDPPTNSAAIDAMNRTITEFEWRINNIKTINPIKEHKEEEMWYDG